jgi:hypothetical protein
MTPPAGRNLNKRVSAPKQILPIANSAEEICPSALAKAERIAQDASMKAEDCE